MRHFFTLGAAAVLAVACGGQTSIGKGLGGAVEADGGNGAPGGKSGGGDPGAGGGTGSQGGDPGKGGAGQGGDPTGQGGAAQGGSAGSFGGKCVNAGDCITPGMCRICSDGSQVCEQADCVGGVCQIYLSATLCPGTCDPAKCAAPANGKGCCLPDDSCGVDYGKGCTSPTTGTECVVDKDCPVPPMPCMPCADGSCAPAWTHCTAGKCGSGIDQCPGAPSWFQLCGDPVCRVPSPPTGVTPCDPALGEKEGGPCPKPTTQCDPGVGCGILLGCQFTGPTTCPK